MRHDRFCLETPTANYVNQLIWKFIGASYDAANMEDAEAWCLLCLHGVFDKSAEMNTGKLQRFGSYFIYRDFLGFRRLTSPYS